ncbi:fatty acid synthase [Plakobranchus ocellatus]|uniref:Fatty acid synthase n=1 Tax=Plakobranchus ocellatus TaxID=259542 RepID=A0AAV4AEF5_9GAST|nr:fatty acid synthase [Plakobranchus ocellatus]
MGKLKNITDFDAEFFGVHSKSANTMDPMLRILLEVVYEAIVDAGESLASLKGTRTGVYIGVSVAEFEAALMRKWTDDDSYMVQGCPHSMFPNWINFFFDLRGKLARANNNNKLECPSCAYDTACSTSLVCMDAAERHMRMGIIDAAIVGGCNLMYRPETSKLFMGMSFLGTSACKAFDVAGDGFVRSEVVSAMYLKKRDMAKRIYATLVTTMTNNDGFQPNGILYPNTVAQEELMKDVYSNLKLNPNEVSVRNADTETVTLTAPVTLTETATLTVTLTLTETVTLRVVVILRDIVTLTDTVTLSVTVTPPETVTLSVTVTLTEIIALTITMTLTETITPTIS